MYKFSSLLKNSGLFVFEFIKRLLVILIFEFGFASEVLKVFVKSNLTINQFIILYKLNDKGSF